MPNLSQQFLFALGTGTTVASSVTIPGNAVSPTGGTTFFSKPEKGDGYYNLGDGIHTVTYTVSPAFTGALSIQATLALDPTDSDWFDVNGTNIIYSQVSGTTTTNYVNFTGNFVWVRAKAVRYQDDSTVSVLAINYNH